mgnify:CR=1 FL=1
MARSERKPAPRKALAADEGNRRAELIRAAGRLFVDKGYDATTIRDIADAVGMRSGSPFYHFKSKQDMLKAVMIEGLQAAVDCACACVEAETLCTSTNARRNAATSRSSRSRGCR